MHVLADLWMTSPMQLEKMYSVMKTKSKAIER